MLSLGLHNQISVQNCGFALVSATGESLQDIKKPLSDREN
jgi:hypothetical protein